MQYSGFRDNIPALAALLLVHPLLRKAYEKVSGGIRVGEHLITVERGVSPKLTAHIVNCLKTHTTRVVHAIVPSQMTMEQLRDAAKGMNIEHIEYHYEPDKV